MDKFKKIWGWKKIIALSVASLEKLKTLKNHIFSIKH